MSRSRTGVPAVAFLPIIALLAALASLSHARALDLRDETAELDAHILIPSPGTAQMISLGFNEAMTDAWWVRALVYYGDGLNRDNGVPDVEVLVRLMNTLDPHFRRAYWWGAHSTTFRHAQSTQDEYRASVEILRRAVKVFPDDWELNWLLGLRLFLDVKPDPRPDGTIDQVAFDKQRDEGVYYIEHAMHCQGAPSNLPETAAAMRTELGQKERGLRELREMILTTDDPKARASLQKRFAGLASDDAASAELGRAAEAFAADWRRDLPYASPSFYVIIGAPPAPGIDLPRMAVGPDFGTEMADFGHPKAHDVH